jgi:hypothetical protein
MTPGIILLMVLILAIVIVCNTPTDHIINLISGILAIITSLLILILLVPVGQVKYQEITPKHLFQNTTCVVAVLDENDTIISTEVEIVNSKLQDIIIYKKIEHNGYDMPLISTYVFTLKGE